VSSVALTWTVPTVAGGFLAQPSTYMRLRAASVAASIANASSSSSDGEAEDYRLALPAFLTVTKTTLGPVGSDVGGPFTFAATNTTDGFSNVTTLVANTALSAGTVT
jgi:GEVED domain